MGRKEPVFGVCKQQRHRPAYPSAQSDQRLCFFYFLESIISNLVKSEISTFQLVSVAEQAGLNLALSETPKTGFLATRPKWDMSTDPNRQLLFSYLSVNPCHVGYFMYFTPNFYLQYFSYKYMYMFSILSGKQYQCGS